VVRQDCFMYSAGRCILSHVVIIPAVAALQPVENVIRKVEASARTSSGVLQGDSLGTGVGMAKSSIKDSNVPLYVSR
jgi:hypothetical protein